MINRKIKSQTQLLAHIVSTVGAWALEEFQENGCTTREEYAQRYAENMESLVAELQQRFLPVKVDHGEFVNTGQIGLSPSNPLPTLEWPAIFGPPPKAWWGFDAQGQLSRKYRDYAAYCD